ncbi:lipopolysaccharide biosynthesis protein [Parasphingorhabdus sp.]|uniref:lipopolysaccharide biosynthesis protein n=1 Tax=Parasphingorhabdus sp. TaxID=2709688 RepID=UPI003D2E3E84
MLGFRSSERHLALAYATAGVSKIATALIQILALPIIARALDVERLGAMLSIAAFASILTIFGQGLSATASYTVSFARSQDDPRKISEAFWSVWCLGLAAAVIITLAGSIALLLGIEQFFADSSDALNRGEIRMALVAMLFHVVLYYGFWTIEGVRAAYQENYVTNSFGLLASICAFAGCIVASYISPSISSFYFALFVLPPAAQAINMILFLRKRRSIILPLNLRKAGIREAGVRLLSYSKAQSGLTLHLQGAVLFSSHFFGLSAGAVMGGMARLIIQMHGFVMTVFNPILPTITKAYASNNLADLKKRLTITLMLAFIIVASFTIPIGIFGDTILKIWLSLDNVSVEYNLPFALFAFGYSMSHLLYVILLSLNSVRIASWRLLVSGLSGVTAFYVFSEFFGFSGLLWVNITAMLLICLVPSMISLFLLTRQISSRLRISQSHL